MYKINIQAIGRGPFWGGQGGMGHHWQLRLVVLAA